MNDIKRRFNNVCLGLYIHLKLERKEPCLQGSLT